MTGAAIRGVVGLIKWQYYTAATINGYTVKRSSANEWSLRATVVSSDKFKMAQGPLLFVAPYRREQCQACFAEKGGCYCRKPQIVKRDGAWSWPIESLQINGLSIIAKLGPPNP